MSKRFSKRVGALLLAAGLVAASPVLGSESKAFPMERSYSALYSQAMNQGYPELARGVAVFRRYRGAIEVCAVDRNSESSKAFGEFLDSVVITFQGYLNSSNLRNRQVRNGIASYVTQCAALIETYARRKAEKYSGGASRLDAEDERLVATSRELHSEMASLLRVGAPSVDGAIAQWKAADLNQWVRDGRFGKAADSLLKLESEPNGYCRAVTPMG